MQGSAMRRGVGGSELDDLTVVRWGAGEQRALRVGTAIVGGQCRCKEACGGFDHRAAHQLTRSNFECWRNPGHNLNELTGAKISIP